MSLCVIQCWIAGPWGWNDDLVFVAGMSWIDVLSWFVLASAGLYWTLVCFVSVLVLIHGLDCINEFWSLFWAGDQMVQLAMAWSLVWIVFFKSQFCLIQSTELAGSMLCYALSWAVLNSGVLLSFNSVLIQLSDRGVSICILGMHSKFAEVAGSEEVDSQFADSALV